MVFSLPLFWGIVTLLAIWLVLWIFQKPRPANPLDIPGKLVEGADGRPSTSKLQFFLWTAVAIFSYVAIWVAAGRPTQPDLLPSFPPYLLIAMGISVVTMTTAKAITTAQVGNGQQVKPPTPAAGGPPPPPTPGGNGVAALIAAAPGGAGGAATPETARGAAAVF